MLYMGTCEDDSPGKILCIMTTPHISSHIESITLHTGIITAITMNPDNTQLITTDENGIICVCDVGGDGSVKTLNIKMFEGTAQFEFAEEVMIHKQSLESKKKKIKELTGKVDELNLNNDHQLRLKEMDHKAKVKEISTKFTRELDTEREKYSELHDEKNAVELTFKERMHDMTQLHEMTIDKVKAKYELRLNQESSRHSSMISDTKQAHIQWNEENDALVSSHQEYLRDLTAEFEEKLRIENDEQKQILDEKDKMKLASDFNLSETDDDCAKEVDQMKKEFTNVSEGCKSTKRRY